MKKFMMKAVVIIATCTSFTLLAHDNVKVVVIPLAGDEPQVATSKKIFFTLGSHTGNLGGLAGADAICQAEADAQPVQGTFKAWLSVPRGEDLIPERPGFVYFGLPYVNVDGTPVASHFIDFLDGNFEGVINSVSNNSQLRSYWTGLRPGGAWSGNNCFNWTREDDGAGGSIGFNVGGTTSVFDWSSNTVSSCTVSRKILCFEQ